jgi:microsomal dipeptidase-like Zn-dependent dipeptidase
MGTILASDGMVGHVNRVVVIAGVGAVELGGDFEGFRRRPEGQACVDTRPNLMRGLLEGGYPAGAVRQIYGRNTLRRMGQVAMSLRE